MVLSFNNLPNEVILEILVRIPPGRGDFRTCYRLNTHLQDLIKAHRRYIIKRMASYQFPVALEVASLNPIRDESLLRRDCEGTMLWLKLLAEETRDVSDFMHAIQSLLQSERVRSRLLEGEHFWCQINEKWLEIGLHLFRRYHSKSYRRGNPETDWHRIPLLESYHDALPPYYILATRHASLAIMMILSAIDEEGIMRVGDEDSTDAVSAEKLTDRALISSIERALMDLKGYRGWDSDYYWLKLQEIIILGNHDPNMLTPEMKRIKHCLLRNLYNLGSWREKTVRGEAGRLPQLKPKESDWWEQHITRKISGIFQNWHAIELDQRRAIMSEMQVEEGDDDSAVECVKNYLLLDDATPEWKTHNEWVLDGAEWIPRGGPGYFQRFPGPPTTNTGGQVSRPASSSNLKKIKQLPIVRGLAKCCKSIRMRNGRS